MSGAGQTAAAATKREGQEAVVKGTGRGGTKRDREGETGISETGGKETG